MDSSKEAHDTFIRNYSKIFHPSGDKLPALKPSVAIIG